MSQVSPEKLLGNQMAGLTEDSSICCGTHCACGLLSLLPVDVMALCGHFHSVNAIHLSTDLSKCGYLSVTVFMHLLCLEPHHPGRLMTWLASRGSFEGFRLHATSSTSLSLNTLYKFTTRCSPQPPPLIFFLVFQHYPFL